VPTKLGHATLASGMTPEDALTVRADLAKARHGFVLASDLHLTFLVTPVREELPMDWHCFYDIFGRLGSTDATIAELVGLSQKYLQVGRGPGQCGGVVQDRQGSDRDVPGTRQLRASIGSGGRLCCCYCLGGSTRPAWMICLAIHSLHSHCPTIECPCHHLLPWLLPSQAPPGLLCPAGPVHGALRPQCCGA
jgi:hypothetical protein